MPSRFQNFNGLQSKFSNDKKKSGGRKPVGRRTIYTGRSTRPRKKIADNVTAPVPVDLPSLKTTHKRVVPLPHQRQNQGARIPLPRNGWSNSPNPSQSSTGAPRPPGQAGPRTRRQRPQGVTVWGTEQQSAAPNSPKPVGSARFRKDFPSLNKAEDTSDKISLRPSGGVSPSRMMAPSMRPRMQPKNNASQDSRGPNRSSGSRGFGLQPSSRKFQHGSPSPIRSMVQQDVRAQESYDRFGGQTFSQGGDIAPLPSFNTSSSDFSNSLEEHRNNRNRDRYSTSALSTQTTQPPKLPIQDVRGNQNTPPSNAPSGDVRSQGPKDSNWLIDPDKGDVDFSQLPDFLQNTAMGNDSESEADSQKQPAPRQPAGAPKSPPRRPERNDIPVITADNLMRSQSAPTTSTSGVNWGDMAAEVFDKRPLAERQHVNVDHQTAALFNMVDPLTEDVGAGYVGIPELSGWDATEMGQGMFQQGMEVEPSPDPQDQYNSDGDFIGNVDNDGDGFGQDEYFQDPSPAEIDLNAIGYERGGNSQDVRGFMGSQDVRGISAQIHDPRDDAETPPDAHFSIEEAEHDPRVGQQPDGVSSLLTTVASTPRKKRVRAIKKPSRASIFGTGKPREEGKPGDEPEDTNPIPLRFRAGLAKAVGPNENQTPNSSTPTGPPAEAAPDRSQIFGRKLQVIPKNAPDAAGLRGKHKVQTTNAWRKTPTTPDDVDAANKRISVLSRIPTGVLSRSSSAPEAAGRGPKATSTAAMQNSWRGATGSVQILMKRPRDPSTRPALAVMFTNKNKRTGVEHYPQWDVQKRFPYQPDEEQPPLCRRLRAEWKQMERENAQRIKQLQLQQMHMQMARQAEQQKRQGANRYAQQKVYPEPSPFSRPQYSGESNKAYKKAVGGRQNGPRDLSLVASPSDIPLSEMGYNRSDPLSPTPEPDGKTLNYPDRQPKNGRGKQQPQRRNNHNTLEEKRRQRRKERRERNSNRNPKEDKSWRQKKPRQSPNPELQDENGNPNTPHTKQRNNRNDNSRSPNKERGPRRKGKSKERERPQAKGKRNKRGRNKGNRDGEAKWQKKERDDERGRSMSEERNGSERVPSAPPTPAATKRAKEQQHNKRMADQEKQRALTKARKDEAKRVRVKQEADKRKEASRREQDALEKKLETLLPFNASLAIIDTEACVNPSVEIDPAMLDGFSTVKSKGAKRKERADAKAENKRYGKASREKEEEQSKQVDEKRRIEEKRKRRREARQAKRGNKKGGRGRGGTKGDQTRPSEPQQNGRQGQRQAANTNGTRNGPQTNGGTKPSNGNSSGSGSPQNRGAAAAARPAPPSNPPPTAGAEADGQQNVWTSIGRQERMGRLGKHSDTESDYNRGRNEAPRPVVAPPGRLSNTNNAEPMNGDQGDILLMFGNDYDARREKRLIGSLALELDTSAGGGADHAANAPLQPSPKALPKQQAKLSIATEHLITMDELNQDVRARRSNNRNNKMTSGLSVNVPGPFGSLRSGSFSPTSRSLQMDDLTFAEFSRRKTDQWNRRGMKSTPTDSPTMAAPTANMRNSPNSNVYSLPSVNNAIWATSTSQPRSRSLQNMNGRGYTAEYDPLGAHTAAGNSEPHTNGFPKNELNQNGSPPTAPGVNPFGPATGNRFNKVIGHNPSPPTHPSPPVYPSMVQSPLHMGLAQTPVQQITNLQNPNNVIIHNTSHYHTTENTNIYTHHQPPNMGPPMGNIINLNALSHQQGPRQR